MANTVVAVVNGEPVTLHDIDEAIFPLYQRFAEDGLPEEEWRSRLREARSQALTQVVEERLMSQAAREAQIAVDGADVIAKLEEAKGRFKSPEAFATALAESGLTESALKQRYADQLRIQRLVERDVRARVTVSPADINEYYAAHGEMLRDSSAYHLRHLLLHITDPAKEAAVRQQAESLKSRERMGVSFAKLAQQYSQDASAAQGGDLGWVKRAELMPELAAMIATLPIGQVSEPIRTPAGYHLFKVEEKKTAEPLTPEQVQVEVERLLYRQKFDALFQQWLDKLKREAYIEIKS